MTVRRKPARKKTPPKPRRKMRPGGGKAKGGSFERFICRELSRWVSGGRCEDVFWRSAISGGRATVGRKKGKSHARQAGDISAVAPEGHSFTDRFFVECKHVRNLSLEGFLLEDRGPIATFWKKACDDAAPFHKRPMLILRQNRWKDAYVVMQEHHARLLVFGRPPMNFIKLTGKYCVCFIRLTTLMMALYNDGSDAKAEEAART